MRVAAAAFALLVAAACAPTTASHPDAGATRAPAPTSQAPTSPAPASPAPPAQVAEADACGASHFQYLIGRSRREIPPTPIGARWRIACTTCMVTMDFMPARLNIFFDQQTDLIKQVRCG